MSHPWGSFDEKYILQYSFSTKPDVCYMQGFSSYCPALVFLNESEHWREWVSIMDLAVFSLHPSFSNPEGTWCTTPRKNLNHWYFVFQITITNNKHRQTWQCSFEINVNVCQKSRSSAILLSLLNVHFWRHFSCYVIKTGTYEYLFEGFVSCFSPTL